MKIPPKKDRRHSRPRESVITPKVWDFDRGTLNEAWIEYHKLPLADRILLRFGQWFLIHHRVDGVDSWPQVFYERRDSRAFEILSSVVEEKEQERNNKDNK